MLIPGESKTMATVYESHLKQALLNSGKVDGHWPGPYLGFPEHGTKFYFSESYTGKPHKVEVLAFVQLRASLRPDYVLPIHV